MSNMLRRLQIRHKKYNRIKLLLLVSSVQQHKFIIIAFVRIQGIKINKAKE